MGGNINKQLASLAFLLLLLVAVSIPVMATDGDSGASDASDAGIAPVDNVTDQTSVTDVTDVTTLDDAKPVDESAGDVVTDDGATDVKDVTLDDQAGDGESGAISPTDEIYYATAYGANLHTGACNVKPACQESKPTTTACMDQAKDAGGCTAKTDGASKTTGTSKTCTRSTCKKAK